MDRDVVPASCGLGAVPGTVCGALLVAVRIVSSQTIRIHPIHMLDCTPGFLAQHALSRGATFPVPGAV